MRLIAWLLLAAIVIAAGIHPPLATAVGGLLAAVLSLVLAGAAALLAQTAIQLLLAAVFAVWLYRNRRIA